MKTIKCVALMSGAVLGVLTACATPQASREQIASARRSIQACLSQWVERLDDHISSVYVIATATEQRCVRETKEYARVLGQGQSDGFAVGPARVAEQFTSDYATRAVREHRASSAKN
jgi:hypothetical protein